MHSRSTPAGFSPAGWQACSLWVLLGAFAIQCGNGTGSTSTPVDTGVTATGGAVSTGGVVGSGGVTSTGGVTNSGGASGTPGTGGSTGAGGMTTTGGVAATTGGRSGAGGVASTGGVAASGGRLGTGGVTSTGGVAGTGGVSSTGTGGVAATGGRLGTGGASGAGGVTGMPGTGGTPTGAFQVTSPGWTNMDGCGPTNKTACSPLPTEITRSGAGTSPELTWTFAPSGTKGFVVVLQDLSNGTAHWILWNVPATTTTLPANIDQTTATPATPAGSQQCGKGTDAATTNGYYGPGAPCNVYEFMVYALSVATFSPTNATDQESVRTQLQALGSSILGTASLRGRTNQGC
jgi:phosphatidylethanolamine-binding protein (PEBP) family uncharacterized protein